MPRAIHDSTGKIILEEQLPVRIRVGKFKGLVGKVQFIRRSTGHPRVYVAVAGRGTWIAPRSIQVIA